MLLVGFAGGSGGSTGLELSGGADVEPSEGDGAGSDRDTWLCSVTVATDVNGTAASSSLSFFSKNLEEGFKCHDLQNFLRRNAYRKCITKVLEKLNQTCKKSMKDFK